MTLEEAKIILINRGFVEINGDLVFDGNKWRNSIAVISKWLEQQPCEDWYDVPSDEMTLEQARQAVKDLRKKLAEYLDQDPCENVPDTNVGDIISRQAVEKITWEEPSYTDSLNVLTEIREKVRALPPVTPKEKIGKWIPISERLPENNGTYLVWDKYGYQISDFNAEEQTFGFLNGCNFDYETGEVYPPCWVEHDTVVAWIPLPAPFEPQESEG